MSTLKLQSKRTIIQQCSTVIGTPVELMG